MVGEPGVGKTRLATEFADAVSDEATLATTRCLPRGESDARQPVRDLVAQLLSGERPADPRTLLEADEAEAIAVRLERLLGRHEGSVPADELPWVVRSYLSAVARDRPLVAVFEDIHWAEPTLLELIEHVAEWTRDSPLLLVCLARPELLDQRPDWGAGADEPVSIPLERLPDRDVLALIESRQDGASLGEETRSSIVEAAEGNPLFVEQMVALVRDRPHRPGGITTPPHIQALLAARLDQLEDREREAASYAAVIGREFSRQGLANLLEAGGSTLPAVLQRLARREFVESEPGSEEFRFRHALIRDAAYDTLPKAVRARLHERHADWLESADMVSASDEAIGYQLERAYRYRDELGSLDDPARELARRAGERLGAAGRMALGRGEMTSSVQLMRRAVDLMPSGSAEALALLPELSTAMSLSGAPSDAYQMLIEAERRRVDRRSSHTRPRRDRAAVRGPTGGHKRSTQRDRH